MRIYYTYRPKFNNNTQSDMTTPSEIFRVSYPEFAWLLTFNDFNNSELLNKIMWERFWYVDFDETIIPEIDVKTELIENKDIRIYIKDSVKMLEWIRSNTNLQEVEPSKFLVSEDYNFSWEIIPAKYLEII